MQQIKKQIAYFTSSKVANRCKTKLLVTILANNTKALTDDNIRGKEVHRKSIKIIKDILDSRGVSYEEIH